MIIQASELVVGPDHLPGPLNLQRILDLISGKEVDERPLEVYQAYPTIWVITNGRHRYISGLIKGKIFFECELRRGGSEWQNRAA